ncbi:hypothetical protein AB5N19_02850 [Seiridium cardinale]
MPKWGISSYLVVVRSLQVLGTLISAILNGFLLVYIHMNRLGLSGTMLALEIMTCITLVYTAIVLLLQHTGRRHLKSKDTITFVFVVGDILFMGLTIGLFSIISRSGVPSNCAGLTRSDYESDDAPDDPRSGYDTVRFGSGDQKGELDHFCALERGYYFITIGILFSYMATVAMGVLRIAEVAFQRKLDERLATANELVRLESKVSRTRASFVRQSSAPSSPLQDGFASPRSPRSFGSRQSLRDPVAQQQQQRRTTIPVSPLTITPSSTPIDPARQSLLINQQRSGESAESVAEAAMITDGYRNPEHQHRALAHASMSAPPPYVPGESSRFMAGHGDESNEMRLSEYVKGQTRAQQMKDSGAV